MAPMSQAARQAPKASFHAAWADFTGQATVRRLIFTIFAGTVAFNMQDVLLEPYGGEILGLSVSATTQLTAMWSLGALIGLGLSARWLSRSIDPIRLAGRGVVVGIFAFAAVLLSSVFGSPILFFSGAFLIGLGGAPLLWRL